MIEKILERLEERVERLTEAIKEADKKGFKLDFEKTMSELLGIKYAKEIVQEVAKEYGEKKYYRIVLSCLEDSTSLEMPLTKQEYLLLTRISDLVYRVAAGCMPTMYVEQKGE